MKKMTRRVLCCIMIGLLLILSMPISILAGSVEVSEHDHGHVHSISTDYVGVYMDETVDDDERIGSISMIGDVQISADKSTATVTFMLLSNSYMADSINITVSCDPEYLTYQNSERRLFGDYPTITNDVSRGRLMMEYSDVGRQYSLGGTQALRLIFGINKQANTSVRFDGIAVIKPSEAEPNPEYTGLKFSATATLNFCEHKTTRTVVTKTPTCQSDGTEEIWCTDTCKQRIGINTIRHSDTYHTYTEKPLKTLVAATCTTTGQDEYKCQVCGQLQIVTVPALGHTFVGTKTLVDGVWKQSCSRCNLLLESPYQCEHDNSKYTLVRITREPTCLNSGTALYACSECNTTATVTLPAQHHYVFNSTVKQATVSSAGQELWICEDCGIRQLREIPKLTAAHTHVYNGKEEIISEATCVVAGKKRIYCSYSGCNEYIEVAIPKLEHELSDWTVAKLASCTEEGLRYRTCSKCNTRFEEKLPMVEHTFGEAVYTAPTCVANGSSVRVCVVCGYADTTTYPASTEYCVYPEDGYVLKTSATCVSEGVYECTCSVCGKTTKTRTVPIDPEAHNWSEWNIVSEADCITDGIKTRSCSLCGKDETSVEKSTGHSFIVETLKNTTVNTCSKCGMVETVTSTKKGNVKSVKSGMFTLTFDNETSGKDIYFNASQMDSKSYSEKVAPYNAQLRERGLGEVEMAFNYALKLNNTDATVASASELSVDVGEEYKKISLALYYLDDNGALQKVNDDFVARQGTVIKVNVGTGTFKYPSGTLVLVNTGAIKSNVAVPIVIAILTIVVAAGVVFFVVSKNKKVTF
ncbi:MAG: hypothetical protein IJR55_02545 [Clostridia bacterium]|nr:hypothetical protein [Clostridia bacterium]